MKVIVTGSNGFIGSNFVQYLMNFEGLQVKCVDLSQGCDLTSSKTVDKEWGFQPDVVVNFASYTHVDDSIKNPRRFWDNNIRLMLNVLEACRKYDCRLLQISSSEVYGSAQYIPMDERHPLNPHSPYALTKVVQDRSVYAWWQTYGLDASIVRPFNNFGPYQQLQKLIPKFTYNLLHGKSVPVYGEGKARRDWLYVKDTVRGIWLAVNKLAPGDVVNLCTGNSWSILEVVDLLTKAVRKITGAGIKSYIQFVEHVDDRLGHVFHLKGSYEKAKKLLGWEPKYTFPRALEETVEWYITHDFKVPIRRGGD